MGGAGAYHTYDLMQNLHAGNRQRLEASIEHVRADLYRAEDRLWPTVIAAPPYPTTAI